MSGRENHVSSSADGETRRSTVECRRKLCGGDILEVKGTILSIIGNGLFDILTRIYSSM